MVQSDKSVAQVIDDLTTADIGGRATIDLISESVAERQGNVPAMQAAERLADAVDSDSTVLILTGFLIPPTMAQETDGPLGAVSVARSIDAGLEANPVIACEPKALDICEATAKAGELSVLNREASFKSRRTVSVESFPTTRDAAQEYADSIISKMEPAAVVAIEKVAPNEAGVYHNMAGYDVSDKTSKIGELYDALNDDVLTVSVGDAGNEVGMGLVQDVVKDQIKYGSKCQCSCGAGIASSIETDILVPATVSNWGGHAIAACLSDIVDTQILHNVDVERRMLEQAAINGGVDGIIGGTNAWCDGLPPKTHESIVQLLHETLNSSVHIRGGGELGR